VEIPNQVRGLKLETKKRKQLHEMIYCSMSQHHGSRGCHSLSNLEMLVHLMCDTQYLKGFLLDMLNGLSQCL